MPKNGICFLTTIRRGTEDNVEGVQNEGDHGEMQGNMSIEGEKLRAMACHRAIDDGSPRDRLMHLNGRRRHIISDTPSTTQATRQASTTTKQTDGHRARGGVQCIPELRRYTHHRRSERVRSVRR